MRKIVLAIVLLIGALSVTYSFTQRPNKNPTAHVENIPELDAVPEDALLNEPGDEALSDVTASSPALAPTALKAIGTVEDFAKEAKQAVEMGIITDEEISSYIEERKVIAKEEAQRLDEEMSYSLDDDSQNENTF